MKKFCMLCALLCILFTTACSSPKTTEKDIKLQGQTEAVWYTVKAPVEGEIRGLILDKGERIRKTPGKTMKVNGHRPLQPCKLPKAKCRRRSRVMQRCSGCLPLAASAGRKRSRHG